MFLFDLLERHRSVCFIPLNKVSGSFLTGIFNLFLSNFADVAVLLSVQLREGLSRFWPPSFCSSPACATLRNIGDDQAGITFDNRNSMKRRWLSFTGGLVARSSSLHLFSLGRQAGTGEVN
ncbi:unnamed protein product [Soboliphyme baturini]|uniref:Secreted protein n=1 Tax=Soboliphyme baturini TaxID=241478 RepID=A0A183IM55_9BILA|nr:unnamed protein product [Soboliphyme baturini]